MSTHEHFCLVKSFSCVEHLFIYLYSISIAVYSSAIVRLGYSHNIFFTVRTPYLLMIAAFVLKASFAANIVYCKQ